MSLDAEFFVALGFVLFVCLLGYLGVHRQLLAALDGRSTSIANELAEAKRLREDAGIAGIAATFASAQYPSDRSTLVKIFDGIGARCRRHAGSDCR